MFFFGFGGLIYITVLLLNAVSILSEDRFLAQIGLTANPDPGFGGRDLNSVSARVGNLIHAVRTVTRYPLMGVNLVIALYKLILG